MRGGVPAGLDAVAAGLEADQPRRRRRRGRRGRCRSRWTRRRRRRATASGSRPVSSSTCGPGLEADDPLEVADDHRERVRAGDRAEQVVGVVDVGDPVPQRLVDRVLEGARPGVDRDDLGAEQPHPGDVERLPLGCPPRPCRRTHSRPSRAAAVALATPCWPAPVSAMIRGLPIRLREQRLAEHVVDLVAPVWLRSSRLSRIRAPPTCSASRWRLGERARPAGVRRRSSPAELARERRVGHGLPVACVELVQRGDQRLGHAAAAEAAEVARSASGSSRPRWQPGLGATGRRVTARPAAGAAGWEPAVTSRPPRRAGHCWSPGPRRPGRRRRRRAAYVDQVVRTPHARLGDL